MTRPALPRRRTLLLCLALAALAAVPYCADGGRRAFVLLDDDVYIYENRLVLDGLTRDGIRAAFTTFREGNWHPLTWLAHMTVATIAGADPWWHHAVPVMLHCLATALFFVALRRMTGDTRRSALAAALFAVHPLHVESVAWAAELKDVLAGLFFMLVLLAWERHARRPGARTPAAATLLLAAGLMAKPMLVTAPFVLLLLDWWPLGRCGAPAGAARLPWGRAIGEKTPLLALALASSLVTFVAQRAGGAVVAAELLPVPDRFANAVIAYGDYLRTVLWPSSLAVFYPYEPFQEPWRTAIAGALLAAVAAAVAALRRRGYTVTGWLWFLGMLLPVIGLVQIGGQARADRYIYLPLAGLAVVASWGAGDLGSRLRRPAFVGAAAALAVAALAALAIRQTSRWRDSETLFRHTLAVTADNAMVHNNLGTALVESGRRDEAIDHFREAVRIQPKYTNARSNLGVALFESAKHREALPQLAAALQLDPGLRPTRMVLARALLELGRPGEAAEHYRSVLAREPPPGGAALHAEAGNQLGIILAQAGRFEEAAAHFSLAVRLQPAFPEALNNLGNSLAALGREDEAERSYREALRLRPDYAEARRHLEQLLAAAAARAPAAAPSGHLGGR